MEKFNKKLFLLFFILAGILLSNSIPRSEYPRPEMVREEWLNLNGWWDFAFDFSNTGEEKGFPQGKGFDRKILVPFAPESELSGVGFLDFVNAVWYRRIISIPEKWKGKRILLHFEAVDYKTTVWINGKRVGEHEGGYTPFSFDVTEFLKPSENFLIVKAFDDLRKGLQPCGKQSSRLDSYSCFYSRTTGIWQTVWLEPVNDFYIEKYKVYPEVENGEVSIFVYMNTAPEDGELCLNATFNGKRKFYSWKKAKKVTLFNIKIKDPKLWSIHQPDLYDMEISYSRGNRTIDRITGYFGLRKIEVRGNKIYFNGKPLFLRMVLDQGFYPDGIYTAPSDEALKKDIEISKDLGFDGARLHQKVFERRFLYWADKLGYIVWGEFADWGLDFSKPESYMIFTKQWGEAIERDFNHPSIIGWCPLNEQWGNPFPGVVENIFKFTKLLDSTRLIIDSSGGFHHVSPDVFDSHNYEQNPEKFKNGFEGLLQSPPKVFIWGGEERNAPYEGQPFFVSEYGGIWWNPNQKDEKAWGYGERPKSEEEFIDRYKKLTEALLLNPAIAGFCYTQLYDIEQEVNGLYTFDRKPKFNSEIFRKINQQKAAIED
ncbi:MAG: sugar-binding domain-containing protein [Acidobacteriota bacterium]